MLELEVIGSCRSGKALLAPAFVGSVVRLWLQDPRFVAAARLLFRAARGPWPPLWPIVCEAHAHREARSSGRENWRSGVAADVWTIEIELDRRLETPIRWGGAGTPALAGVPRSVYRRLLRSYGTGYGAHRGAAR
jgi:hypothetical protein